MSSDYAEAIEQWAMSLTDNDRFERLVSVVEWACDVGIIFIDEDGAPYWDVSGERL